MTVKAFIALIVISMLISVGMAVSAVSLTNSTATKSQTADTVVPSSSSIGKTEKGAEVTRIDDTAKGVACYILEYHHAMSCVKVSP